MRALLSVVAACVAAFTVAPVSALSMPDTHARAAAAQVSVSSSDVVPGAVVDVSGRVSPRAKRTVVLQRSFPGARWVKVATQRSTKRGKYRFRTLAPSTPGIVLYRVRAPKARIHGRLLRTLTTDSVIVTVTAPETVTSSPTPSVTPTSTTTTTSTTTPTPTPTVTTTTVPATETTPNPTTPTTPSNPTTPPGNYDSTYYAPALGLSGTELRTTLHDIIDGNAKISYAQVWDALKVTDQDPANPNNVIELYTGKSIAKTANGGTAGQWNREHVWAQSRGGFTTSTGPGTDLHHLRPEDVGVNSKRGNKDFDDGGTTVTDCLGCATDADSFQPRAAVKGDVARMLFYMAIRYEGDDGFNDLELSPTTGSSSSQLGVMATLLRWHAQDPVDAFEMRRNDVIYTDYQFNRNPFIDHPEWATAIWGPASVNFSGHGVRPAS